MLISENKSLEEYISNLNVDTLYTFAIIFLEELIEKGEIK